MKTTKNLLTLAFAMFATFAFAQITNSAHDFSAATWNSGTDEICITCHTPHNALSTSGPLWNHAESVNPTYGNYTSTTLDATIGEPSASAKLCLSCHDGTVDMANYGGVTTATGNAMGDINANANLGTSLTTHHPVSFTYDAALVTADGLSGGGLHDPTALDASVQLFAGNVECATCHDPHGTANASLLVMSNAGSLLCLECHNK